MSAETLTGTLNRSRLRKQSSTKNWFADWIRSATEDAGLAKIRYYPETGFVSGDMPNTTGRSGMVWKLASLKAFDGVPNGARVRFTAQVEHWDNGNGHSLGGTCRRVRNVECLPPSVRDESAVPP